MVALLRNDCAFSQQTVAASFLWFMAAFDFSLPFFFFFLIAWQAWMCMILLSYWQMNFVRLVQDSQAFIPEAVPSVIRKLVALDKSQN